jgi:hypothetical protein
MLYSFMRPSIQLLKPIMLAPMFVAILTEVHSGLVLRKEWSVIAPPFERNIKQPLSPTIETCAGL